MSKIFYYDYFALKNVDIPTWYNSFFWPVPRETTTQITLDFVAAFNAILESVDDKFIQDCCIIGNLVQNLFIRATNHYIVVESLIKGGYKIHYSDKLDLVPQFLRPNEDMYFPPARLPGPSTKSLTTRRFKNFIYSLWYNRSKLGKCLDHFNTERCVTAFSSSNVIQRPYTENLSDWVRVLSSVEWQGIRGNVSSFHLKSLDTIASEYVSFAKNYAHRNFDVSFPPTLCSALLRYAQETLHDIAHGYSGLLNLMNKAKPKRLLTPTGGDPFTRAVSLAARHHGVHVTGFSHGYYIGHNNSPRQAFVEMATVDSYMAYTPGSVPLITRNLLSNRPVRGNNVTIEHENTPIFRDLYNSWKSRLIASNIKTVMVLELLLKIEWAGYNCAETMVNYHFYYTICRMLSDLGYDVVFKRRPKDLAWGDVNIFKDIPRLRVEYRPFETPGVLESVDAVVIQYAMSSTLHWSMCTNKPVIYVDSGWEPWYPDVYEKMARRCRVLPCAYDERNRATFSQEDLLAAVTPPPTRPDTEYITEYLFPEGSA